MVPISLRPVEPDRDFEQLAAWFSILEDEPTTAADLEAYYEQQRKPIVRRVAEDEQGELLGFFWATHIQLPPERVYTYLFVRPDRRGQGVGRRLYEELRGALGEIGVNRLRVSVWDTCPQGRAFAERRGFSERVHQMAMRLDLRAFDDRPYDEILARLEGEGFRFASMEALGNTEEAQRKLYVLNETTSMDIPGAGGEPSWASFEDFQSSVCQKDWYRPGGQIVAIDTASGNWAAMSAITLAGGGAYAYNLHSGVDRPYRGRKLAQAVKVLALRYARDVLRADTVRTHHLATNLPIIAIDRKLGYVQLPGTLLMEKVWVGEEDLRLVAASPQAPAGLAELLADLGGGERGFGGTPVHTGEETAEQYLRRCCEMPDPAKLRPGYVPQTVYWVLDATGLAVGMVRVRHYLNEQLLRHGGHIGYYVRRDRRGRGYATAALRLALGELKKLGQPRALLTVDADNPASIRVIEANGGRMENSEVDPATARELRRYWIEL
jgi:predicted acetyltransferase/predicted GNAT family acetyltransferase